MEKVFVDTDIIMDLLSERKPFYQDAAKLFSLADQHQIKIYISAISISNLHYILSKSLNAELSRKYLIQLKTLVNVLPVNDKILSLALSSDFKDFEDAIQYYTAIEHKIRLLLTRNLKDYKTAGIAILSPEQFIKGVL